MEGGGQIPNTILSVYHIIVLLQILLIHFKLLLSISSLYQRLLELTSPIIKLMYATNLMAIIKGGGELAWPGCRVSVSTRVAPSDSAAGERKQHLFGP